MNSGSEPSSTRIIENAKAFGASLAGIASLDLLKKSPSHQVGRKPGLPVEAKSAIVLALAHETSEPELDWWDNREGGTPGNRRLIRTANSLSQWLKEAFNIHCQPLPYHVEKGGIFLKDAAALAGLGAIGKNNLLITPQFGPRVRLRALLVDVELEPTGPTNFTPCEGCDMPCRSICPQHAFASSSYVRALCGAQMKKDETDNIIFEKSANGHTPSARVKYCRACELSCPVGRRES
jgi:epoxyqueuosine reductase